MRTFFKRSPVVNPVILIMVLMITIITVSCKKEPKEQSETAIITQWIWDEMNYIYLWADDIPASKYSEDASDPMQYFYSLLNEKDRFSWIVDDIDALLAQFQGTELSNGINPGWVLLSGTDQVVAVVAYVAEDSPAADSGIARGDIIYEVNGERMDTTNYYTKFYQQTAAYSFADATPDGLVPNGKSIELTAVVLDENPVQHAEIIDYEGVKIGYLVYTQFAFGEDDIWLTELNNVLDSFKNEAVDDVVIDLRYNPGGYGDMAAYIGSCLVPPVNATNHDIFNSLVWNDQVNQDLKEADLNKDGVPDGEDSDWLVEKFPDTDYNLNLSSVYFLTSYRSASASELLITGVEAYTDVIQIGDYTVGKFYGSLTIGDSEDPPRHNWAMQPLCFKYANAAGYTDFENGLIPDYYIRDYLIGAVPFGDLRDPMLSKALEVITGVAPAVKKSAVANIDYRTLPDPRQMALSRSIMLNKRLPADF